MLRIAAHTLQPPPPLNLTDGEPAVPLSITNGSRDTHMSLYLHGKLQLDNGFDIAEPFGGELTLPTVAEPKREERCLVLLPHQQYPVRARIVMWLAGGRSYERVIGLIVYEDDTEALSYARKKAAQLQAWI